MSKVKRGGEGGSAKVQSRAAFSVGAPLTVVKNSRQDILLKSGYTTVKKNQLLIHAHIFSSF